MSTLFSNEYLKGFRDAVAAGGLGPATSTGKAGAFDAAPSAEDANIANVRATVAKLERARPGVTRKIAAALASDAAVPPDEHFERGQLHGLLGAKLGGDAEGLAALKRLRQLDGFEQEAAEGEDTEERDISGGGTSPSSQARGGRDQPEDFTGKPPTVATQQAAKVLSRAHDARIAMDQANRRRAAEGPSKGYAARWPNAANRIKDF